MITDPRIEAAREAARKSHECAEEAQKHLSTRNEIVLELRNEDPDRWTYKTLADALGVSIGTVAKIVKRVI